MHICSLYEIHPALPRVRVPHPRWAENTATENNIETKPDSPKAPEAQLTDSRPVGAAEPFEF